MKLKKIVALATSAVLASSLLASCGTANRTSYEENGETLYTYYLNMYTQDSTESVSYTHLNMFTQAAMAQLKSTAETILRYTA